MQGGMRWHGACAIGADGSGWRQRSPAPAPGDSSAAKQTPSLSRAQRHCYSPAPSSSAPWRAAWPRWGCTQPGTPPHPAATARPAGTPPLSAGRGAETWRCGSVIESPGSVHHQCWRRSMHPVAGTPNPAMQIDTPPKESMHTACNLDGPTCSMSMAASNLSAARLKRRAPSSRLPEK